MISIQITQSYISIPHTSASVIFSFLFTPSISQVTLAERKAEAWKIYPEYQQVRPSYTAGAKCPSMPWRRTRGIHTHLDSSRFMELIGSCFDGEIKQRFVPQSVFFEFPDWSCINYIFTRFDALLSISKLFRETDLLFSWLILPDLPDSTNT